MGIYEELQARGLIAQVTDEEEIRELVYSISGSIRPPTAFTWDISWRCV